MRTTAPVGHPGQHRPLDQFGIGEAVLIAPFFAVGHVLAVVTGEPRDGFSWPYQYAAGAAGLAYMLLGLALVAATLRRYFARRTVVVTLLALTFGAAVFDYGTYEATLSHAFSFCLVALVVWLTLWVWERPRYWSAAALGAALGLVGLVRVTNLVVLAFCALVGIERLRDVGGRARALLRRAGMVATGAAAFAVVFVWQSLYWNHITGAWFVNAYRGQGEHLDLLHPHLIGVLFSVRKGLFFWTPLVLLAVAGLPLLRRTARPLFVPAVVYLAVATWVVASWSIWWYGASFGMRALIDEMPVFALGLAALVESARTPAARRVLVVALAVTTVLALHGMVAYGARRSRTTGRAFASTSTRSATGSSPGVAGEHAAVDDEVRAGDPARRRRGEEEHGVGDVGRRAEALERRRRVPARDAFGPRLVEAGRVDQAGGDAVHADPARPELERRRARVHDDRRLRGGVVAVVRGRLQALDRARR